MHARHSTARMAITGAAETYLWLVVRGLASYDVHVCEVSGLSVVLQVCRPHHSHLRAQVQLLAQVCPPLHLRVIISNGRSRIDVSGAYDSSVVYVCRNILGAASLRAIF